MSDPQQPDHRLKANEIQRQQAAASRETSRPSDSTPVAAGQFAKLPATFGRYQVEKLLGRGAMGAVYLARDTQLNRAVALKIPKVAASGSKRLLLRLETEAKAAAQLDHPSLCKVYDAGEFEGQCFIAMQYIEGETLKAHLEAKSKSVAEAVMLIVQIAEGLSEAHELGIIHRDLKPENIMINRRGIPVIMDFGLAKLSTVNNNAMATQAGTILGSPAYMSPEQASGQTKEIDRRSDIYALGTIFFELLTGQLPFTGSTMQILGQKSILEPASPLSLKSDLPPQLAAVCLKMIARKGVDRHQSLSEVIDDLKKADAAVTLSLVAPSAQAPEASPSLFPDFAGLHRAENRNASSAKPKQKKSTAKADGSNAGVKTIPQGLIAWWNGRPPSIKWTALGGLGALFVLGVIIITITNEDGSQTEIKVPDKSTVAISAERVKKEDVGLRPAVDPVATTEDEGNQQKGASQIAIENRLNALVPAGVPASKEFEAFRRDQLTPEALAFAGNGDPTKAPDWLVGALGTPHPNHTQPVLDVSISPDGRWTASASEDHTIILEETATGKGSRVLTGHSGPVSAARFSKDGQTLFSASHDGTLRLWPIGTNSEPEIVKLDLAEIGTMAVSRDDRFIAAGGVNRGVKLWPQGQWNAPRTIADDAGKATALALSPDGNLLAVGWNTNSPLSQIRIYQTLDGKLLSTLEGHGPNVASLDFSSDGKYLASVGTDSKAKVWDLAASKVSKEFDILVGTCVSFSPDGKLLAVGKERWQLDIFDLESRSRLHTIYTLNQGSRTVRFSPDASRIVIGTGCGEVRYWSITDRQFEVRSFGHVGRVNDVAISPDGKSVLSVGGDCTLRRWSLAFPVQNQILDRQENGLQNVDFRSDGQRYLVCNYTGGNIRDAKSDKVLFSSPPTAFLTFSQDNKILGGHDGTNPSGRHGYYGLWDASTGSELHRFPSQLDGGPNNSPAFSPDGKLIAGTFWTKNYAKVWNIRTGAEVHTLTDTEAFSVAFSPDGQTIATGHKSSINLWNLSDGKKIRSFNGHSTPIHQLQFTPDGKMLISAGSDGSLRVWKIDVDRAFGIVRLGPADQRLTFSLDASGHYLVVGGQGPLIYVLRIPDQDADQGGIKGAEPAPEENGTAPHIAPPPSSAELKKDTGLVSQKNGLVPFLSVTANKAGQEWTAEWPGIVFCWCPPGRFTMGSPRGEAGHREEEEPMKVLLSRGFWLGKTEVTRGQWLAVIGSEPGNITTPVGKSDLHPIERVVRGDQRAGPLEKNFAMEFCERLTEHERSAGRLPEGWKYDLPTEAQWEYACRAGTKSMYSFANNSSRLNDYAWWGASVGNGDVNAGARPVGGKRPNSWGFHDMHGNVWELCSDRYSDKRKLYSKENDPTGPQSGDYWVVRGGAWFTKAEGCRSASRNPGENGQVNEGLIGFRVALVNSGSTADMGLVADNNRAVSHVPAESPDASKKSNKSSVADPLEVGSVWEAERAVGTITVLERKGTVIRVHYAFNRPTNNFFFVNEVQGKVIGNKVSWFSKDAKIISGARCADAVGTISKSNGSRRIDFDWSDGTMTGKIAFLKKM